jgi:phage terminase large subunit
MGRLVDEPAERKKAQLPKLHKKQLEVFGDTRKIKVMNWGRRSGKSTEAYIYTLIQAIRVQGLYYIIAPTYKQAKAIYWQDVVKPYTPPLASRKEMFNETELSITLPYLKGPVKLPDGTTEYVEHNDKLGPSRIIFKGAEDPDSLRGVALTGAVLDEYAFMDHGKATYDKIIAPALADHEGWVIFISTPDGIYNHFYDLYQEALKHPEDYFYSHATAQDNPYFPKGEFERQRVKALQEGKMLEFMQEWMAEFNNPAELVYNNFSMTDHVVMPRDVPSEGTDILGIDFGFSPDPFAALYVRIDKDNNWWIYDEVYAKELTMQKAEQALYNKMGDRHFSRIIGDAAAKFDIHSMKKLAFPIKSSKKGADSIRAGIREVYSKLEIREGTGKPKLFITTNCKNTIREFQSYSYLKDAYDEITNTPEDKNNHALDALRYLALDFARHSKPSTKDNKIYHPTTGRLIGYKEQ